MDMFRWPSFRSFFPLCVVVFISAFVLAGCSLPFRKAEVSGLQITTDGIASSVLLNGNKVGMTPFSDQELKPGTYTVRLEPEDSELAMYETSITLYPTTLAVMNWTFGRTAETSGGVIYELDPLKKKTDANLSIASIPDGAIVKVDDVSQGFTPVLMKSMTPGTHRFQVTLPSYKDEEESINIAEGFQMNVTVKLAKQKVSETVGNEVVATDSAEASDSAKVATPSSKPSTTPKASLSPKPEVSKAASSSAKPTSSTAVPGKTVTIKETGTGWLRVRETASSSGKELAKVDVGESFPFFETQSGWTQIEYEKGKKGWVSSQYVKQD